MKKKSSEGQPTRSERRARKLRLSLEKAEKEKANEVEKDKEEENENKDERESEKDNENKRTNIEFVEAEVLTSSGVGFEESAPLFFCENASQVNEGFFRYEIKGIFEVIYYYAVTNRATTFWGKNEEYVTIIPFKNNERAKELAEALQSFIEFPDFLNFIYLNEDVGKLGLGRDEIHLVIEGFEDNLGMVKAKFIHANGDWQFFAKECKTLFFGVVKIMARVFGSDYSIPKLFGKGTLSIGVDGTPKLGELIKLKGDINRSLEINDLGESIVKFLTCEDEFLSHDDKLIRAKVPVDVRTFANKCIYRTQRSQEPDVVFLDFAGFWDYNTIIKWVFSVGIVCHDWTHESAAFAKKLDSILLKKLNQNIWEHLIPKEGRLRDLFSGYMEDCGEKSKSQMKKKVKIVNKSDNGREKKNGNKTKGKEKRYKVCAFYRLLRFYRNVIIHYNDKCKKKIHRKKRWEICMMMEKLFYGRLCTILQETLIEALMASPPRGFDWTDMLSSPMLKCI